MNRIILFLLIIMLYSCGKVESDHAIEIEKLKTENDSLKSILTELKGKYIFDEIRADFIRSNNSNKIGTEFEGKFFITAFNKSDYVLFSKNLSENKIDLINPDTLRPIGGNYKFQSKLDSKENNFIFKIYIGNKYGESIDGKLLIQSQDAN